LNSYLVLAIKTCSLLEDAVVSALAENANPQILARMTPNVTWDTSEMDKFAVPLNQRTAQLKQRLISAQLSFAKTEIALPTPPFNVEPLKTPLALTVLAFLLLVCARPLKPVYALLNKNAKTRLDVTTTTNVPLTTVPLMVVASGPLLTAVLNYQLMHAALLSVILSSKDAS